MNQRPTELPAAPSCPSELLLDQLDLGELSAKVEQDLRQHIASCPRCAAATEARVARRASFLRDPALQELGRQVRSSAAQDSAPGPRWLSWLSSRWRAAGLGWRSLGWTGFGAAILAATVLVMLRQDLRSSSAPPDRVLVKGGELSLSLHRASGGGSEPLRPGALVPPGLRLGLHVRSAKLGYALLLVQDGLGQVQRVDRDTKGEELVVDVGESDLPLSLVLDETPGRARVVLIRCAHAPSLQQVKSETLAPGHELELETGCVSAEAELWVRP